MASPDNSPPPRPRSVPDDARWDPKEPGFEWVRGALDDDGRRHGPQRSWNRDGALHGECTYDHGKVHGTDLNFHPDGTISSKAEWVHGVIMDSVFFRSEAPTTEPFAQAAAAVWSVHYYTRDGRTNYTIRYFTKAGTECGPDGNPLPPRPPGVSPDARWFPEIDRWVDGEIARGTNTQVGRWRWWSPGGVLRHEEVRDAHGEATLIAQYDADGALEKKTTRSATGEERGYYEAGGALATRYRDDALGRHVYHARWRDGVLDEETRYAFDGDELASVTERGPGGALAFEARREGPAMACLAYAPGGKTAAATGLLTDGQLRGIWRIFGDDGAVRREVDTTALAISHPITGDRLAGALGEALYRTDEPALATPPQLAGVDDEPWADTPGCYDDRVEELPRLLRALVAPDPLVRDYALAAIEDELAPPCPATARAIPYLARLLAHAHAPRTRLLAMIELAGATAQPFVGQVAGLAPDDDQRLGVEGTALAVAAAWPDVFASFATASPPDRLRILVLARWAPGAKRDVLDVARGDADPAMRACAIDAIAPACQPSDLAPCLADRDLLVRTAAALAIAATSGPEAPREAIDALGDAARNWRQIASRFEELPHTEGHVLAALARSAGAICTPDARSLAQVLCAPFHEVDERSAIGYGEGLLALALGRGQRPFAKRFVEILGTLARSPQFDGPAARDVLARWNLPHDLAAFVAELEAAPDPEALAYARLG